MATGAAGAIGKFFKGVAEVGVPAALEQHRANILAKRDAILQGYNMESQKAQNDFTSTENAADRDQRSRENSQQVALQAGQLGVAQENLNINREQADLAAKQIAQQLEIGDLTLQQAKQLEDVRKQLVEAETPEEMDAAYDLYTRLTGDAQTDRYQATTIYGEENELGEPTRATGVLNTRTGQIAPAAMGQSPAAPGGDNDPLGIRGLFEQTAPQASAAPTPTPTPSPAQPPVGAISQATTAPAAEADILEGFTMPQARTGARSTSSNEPTPSRGRPMESEDAAIVRDIKQVLDSRDLTPLAGRGMDAKIQQALTSGLLSDLQVRQLNAFLARK